jgi:excisionase family DNA binding protein
VRSLGTFPTGLTLRFRRDNICDNVRVNHNTDRRGDSAPGEGLISVAEAADLLRISQSTLWRWIDQETVQAYRIGRKHVWLKKSDLEPRRQRESGGRVQRRRGVRQSLNAAGWTRCERIRLATTVSRRGVIHIPGYVARKVGFGPGDRVIWQAEGDGFRATKLETGEIED